MSKQKHPATNDAQRARADAIRAEAVRKRYEDIERRRKAAGLSTTKDGTKKVHNVSLGDSAKPKDAAGGPRRK